MKTLGSLVRLGIGLGLGVILALALESAGGGHEDGSVETVRARVLERQAFLTYYVSGEAKGVMVRHVSGSSAEPLIVNQLNLMGSLELNVREITVDGRQACSAEAIPVGGDGDVLRSVDESGTRCAGAVSLGGPLGSHRVLMSQCCIEVVFDEPTSDTTSPSFSIGIGILAPPGSPVEVQGIRY